MINEDQLANIFTRASYERIAEFLEPINATCDEFAISTPLRVAAFLSQIGHESGQLRYVKELWGPTPAQLRYEGRVDLGNVEIGDGKRFMGRGLIQITGRGNYRMCGEALYADLEEEPELLETPELAARSAGWYWKVRAINVPADMGDIKRVTKLVNGGYNGLEERIALYERAKRELL